MGVQTRIVIDLSEPAATVLVRLAKERGLSRPALVRQAIGVLQAMHDGAKEGYLTGLTKDRAKLDSVLVAPL
jgi:hypothetical protein